jgi:hypothetical protein
MSESYLEGRRIAEDIVSSTAQSCRLNAKACMIGSVTTSAG